MRTVLLLLLVAALAVSGWFIWQNMTETSKAPEQTVVPLDIPAPEPSPAPEPAQVKEAPVVNTPSAPVSNSTSPQALAPAQSIPASQVDTAKLLLDGAVEAFNGGDYNTSLRLFIQALPYNNDALTGIGLSYYKLGKYRKAADELTRSVEENGPEFKALKFLSLAYYKLDDLEKSETYATRALAVENDREFRTFYEKVQRERHALTNRVDESNLHFKVIFDGYEHGSISRLILDTLDSAYRDIGREFDYFPDRTITVVLYTERDFFDVTRAPAWSGGLYDGKIRVPVKGAESVDRELLRTVLYHEYVHAMVHDIAQNVPRWVHEGLAEYLVPRGLDRIGQVIPFPALEGAFLSGNGRVAMTAYEESYSAIAYLVDRYNLYDIKQFLLAMGHGQSPEQAFYDTFLITYDEFAKSWGVGSKGT